MVASCGEGDLCACLHSAPADRHEGLKDEHHACMPRYCTRGAADDRLTLQLVSMPQYPQQNASAEEVADNAGRTLDSCACTCTCR